MPLARHDSSLIEYTLPREVSTHMPLARHDALVGVVSKPRLFVSTHMPLARHDMMFDTDAVGTFVSTHMPLARHDRCWR